jgi:hypothetical protein
MAAENPGVALEVEVRTVSRQRRAAKKPPPKSAPETLAQQILDRTAEEELPGQGRIVPWKAFVKGVKDLSETGMLRLDLKDFLKAETAGWGAEKVLKPTAHLWVARDLRVRLPNRKVRPARVRLFDQGGMHEYLMDSLSEAFGLDGRDFAEREAVVMRKDRKDPLLVFRVYDRESFRRTYGEAERIRFQKGRDTEVYDFHHGRILNGAAVEREVSAGLPEREAFRQSFYLPAHPDLKVFGEDPALYRILRAIVEARERSSDPTRNGYLFTDELIEKHRSLFPEHAADREALKPTLKKLVARRWISIAGGNFVNTLHPYFDFAFREVLPKLGPNETWYPPHLVSGGD